jgi:crossover junction endodeoxyribonuclease RuvC
MTRFVGIDPATNTGFVALDEKGNVLRAKELTGVKSDTPHMIRTLHDEIWRHLYQDDLVAIEGFALDAQDTNKVSSGCNWAARMATDRKVGAFISPRPIQLKKFVDVSEWEPDPDRPGKKRRLTGKAVKKMVMEQVELRWGYKPPTDNIADAYVLAKIAEAVHDVKCIEENLGDYPPYQQEVIMAIIDPSTVKKPKKTKPKTNKRRGKPAAADGHIHLAEQQFLF